MLRIRSAAVGGAFGGKNEVTLEPWVALLAKKTGRPVKMVFSREEDLNTSTVRHSYKMTYKTGVTREGRILANAVTILADSGAYLGLGSSTMLKAIVHACGPYAIANVRADAYLVYTNTLIGSSMRGMGVPQVCFALESHPDSLHDPLPLRLRRGGDPRNPGDPRGKSCANERNRKSGSVRETVRACYHHPKLG